MSDEQDPSGIISDKVWEQIQEGEPLEISHFDQETGQTEYSEDDNGD